MCGLAAEVCRAPTPTPTQTGLDSTTPNIGAGVTIGRGWSLDGAEFKASSLQKPMSIECIYIKPLLVNDRVETTLI